MGREFRRGDVVGPYTIIGFIDGGGNADVYEAETHAGRVALKVLRTRRGDSEPYRRFRQEVRKHHELSQRGTLGILPLLDCEVPDAPNQLRPAWMAMPVAEPIETALGHNPPLAIVVGALASVASTLAQLHTEGVAHRDIKPTNLYRYDGAWVVRISASWTFPTETR